MREVRRFIQRVRSDIYRYRIRLCLYDTAKIRSIIVVTICVVLACLYVFSVGQACLEELRYIRGVTVVRF
nr:MAG TPA: hypothetical protein [Caudoviricetes sp.]